MQISASVRHSSAGLETVIRTGDASRALPIPAKADAPGSAVNGGELLMLALATCYCNDLYREAVRLGIAVDGVEVEARARFAGVGLAASDIRYRVRVDSPADGATIADLIRCTDAVAEVHNTLRAGVPVVLVE